MTAKKTIEIGMKTTGMSAQLNSIEQKTQKVGLNARNVASQIARWAGPAAAAGAAFTTIKSVTAEILQNVREAADIQREAAHSMAAFQSLFADPAAGLRGQEIVTGMAGRFGGLQQSLEAGFALVSNQVFSEQNAREVGNLVAAGQVKDPKQFIDAVANAASAGGIDFQTALNFAARGGAGSQLSAGEFGQLLSGIMPSGTAIGLSPEEVTEIFSSARGEFGERMRTGLASAFSKMRVAGVQVKSAEDIIAYADKLGEKGTAKFFGDQGVRGIDALRQSIRTGAMDVARQGVTPGGFAGQEFFERVRPRTRGIIEREERQIQRKVELGDNEWSKFEQIAQDVAGERTEGTLGAKGFVSGNVAQSLIPIYGIATAYQRATDLFSFFYESNERRIEENRAEAEFNGRIAERQTQLLESINSKMGQPDTTRPASSQAQNELPPPGAE